MKTRRFDQHVQREAQLLQRFAYGLTRDRENSKDLLQETMLRAYASRRKFQQGTNLRAWLFTIMRNTFFTTYQKKKNRPTLSYSTEDYCAELPTVENFAYSVFSSRDINLALSKISKQLREPFLMHFRGFKYQEIAEILRVPIGTVKSRIHLARKHLRAILEPYRELV